ncbi:bifunctional folylpolyglutamate synthase/dihydrofolate synthase, partial [Lactobacillus nasalidis]
MKFKTVNELTDYLYHLPRLHEKSDLTYVKRVLKALGQPQDQVKCCHITGTNGKGSTAYYLSNLLQKAGQQTGLFVSPFIVRFNERIQLNGQAIADEELLEAANRVEEAVDRLRESDPGFALVTFEYEVAMAFDYFARKKCDYAVIEVGIGAEHDKTNVITPAVSLITTIGMDHEQIIGPTLADIAREKSGIIKPGVPVVLGDIPPEVQGIIEDKIRRDASPASWLGRDFQVQVQADGCQLLLGSKEYRLPAWPL